MLNGHVSVGDVEPQEHTKASAHRLLAGPIVRAGLEADHKRTMAEGRINLLIKIAYVLIIAVFGIGLGLLAEAYWGPV